MKRSRKSNRVTWAPGLNLCQVRLFLAEDCPSKVGMQTQDHLQKKKSVMVHHLNGKEFSDLPPGFEGSHYLNPLKEESCQVPKIQWRCPPKFVMNQTWNVAAGEESQEAEAQKFREMRVLEAVFPRASAIPPCPSVSLDIEGECYDDRLTPIIPLSPIEEEGDIASELLAPRNTCISSQSPAIPEDLLPPANKKPTIGLLPTVGAGLITAASAALAALKKSADGSLIDTDLLIKIFNDPKMIEKLMNDAQAPTSKPASRLIIPSCAIPHVTSSQAQVDGRLVPKTTPMLSSIPASCHESAAISMPSSLGPPLGEVQTTVSRVPPQPETVAAVSLPRPESITTSVSNLCSMPDQVRFGASAATSQPITAPKSSVVLRANVVPPSLGAMQVQPKLNGTPKSNMEINPVKDINYIKNLIREHGSEKKELGNHTNYIQNKELRAKFQKPCMYYRSPKGCRNGSKCPYQHDISFQSRNNSTLEGPVAKRMKFGGAITGRT